MNSAGYGFAQSNKPAVLAVDDMPGILHSVVKMLKDRYEVMGCTSGEAALKAIERHTPSIFLLDIEMPQMDGYELARVIRSDERFKETPIIFLTAKSTREDVISAMTHGGNDYIVKPVKREMLLSKIEQLIYRDRFR